VILKNNKYIFQAENEQRVQQWHFNTKKIIYLGAVALLFISALAYFFSDIFVKVVYKSELTGIHQEYNDLAITIQNMESQVDKLTGQIGQIEEKDKAVRSYADLPQIDKDIRQLGIGGRSISPYTKFDKLIPNVEIKVSALSTDIDALARKVKLELNSYTDIYNSIKKDAIKVRHIPTIRPVEGGYLTTGFRYRIDPLDNKRRFHYGQDVAVNYGTPVFAPADGIIRYTKYNGGYGKTIKIDHGYGYSTFFAHLQRYTIKSRQSVKRGDLVGYSGNSGRSTGPHLHYEVHYYGKPQNPLDYFFSAYLK
jgi:murein DD-endopeptidase MepM/ murein hydrolase activator NlpD